MGVLNGPRINFWGGIQTNVCVANNADKIGDAVMLDLATATVSSQFSDQEIIDQIRKPSGSYYTEGGWNYYGDHQVSRCSHENG